MLNLLHKAILILMFSSLAMAQGAENEPRELSYKGNEQDWQTVSGSWQSNEAGDLLVEGRGLALNTEQAYGDCVVSGKWQFRYTGDASP